MLHPEHVSPAILEWDADLRLSCWSKQAEQALGWSAHEVIGLRPEQAPFLATGNGAALRLALERIRAGESMRDGSLYRVRTRSGEEHHCAWLSYPLTGRTGRTVAVVSMVHDTEGFPAPGRNDGLSGTVAPPDSLPAEEEAKRKDAAAAKFLAMLRRHLGMPAEAMLATSRLLLETTLTPAQRVYAEQLHAGGETMLRLLEDATNPEHGGTPAAMLRGRRLLLVQGNDPERLPALRQLQNLGIVAVTVPSGHIALELLARGVEFDAAIVDMDLPGTGPEQLTRLAAGHPDGLPLLLIPPPGRPLARKDLPGLERAIVLEEPFGLSSLLESLFDLLFPSRTEPDTTMSTQPSLKILIAEDTPVNQRVASLMLEKLGYHPDVAGNGHEVLAALWRTRYDLILMDVEMPEMDGITATARIRREFPHDRQPRIIAMTANEMEGYKTFCLESGMDGYLAKPLNREALQKALGSIRPQDAEKGPESAPDEADHGHIDYLRSLRTMLGTDDPAALGELIDQYLANTAESIVYLRRKYAERNTTELARIAHSLKSSSRIFGAVRLSELFARLEGAGHACALEQVDDLLADIVAEFQVEGKRLEGERGGD